MSERYYGRFERRIALPTEVDEAKVSASFKKGILTVTLPKLLQALEKVIDALKASVSATADDLAARAGG